MGIVPFIGCFIIDNIDYLTAVNVAFVAFVMSESPKVNDDRVLIWPCLCFGPTKFQGCKTMIYGFYQLIAA